MPTQLALSFDAVPVTCPVQQRYHSIAPCLAGVSTPAEQAETLNVSYSTITRWLREFKEKGMPGLFSETQYPRGPYTPERVIVYLILVKCYAPKAGDRELARVVQHLTGHLIDHHTVKSLLERFFFWRYPDFQRLIQYPAPSDPLKLREEVVKLRQQGWTEVRIAQILRINRKTVIKWLRRARQRPSQSDNPQLPLFDLSRARHRTSCKYDLSAMNAVLKLQRKYGYAGAWRIKGLLEADYGISLGETTVRKIMALNRRLHLAPQRPIAVVEARDPREGPPKSSH
jgi:transposase